MAQSEVNPLHDHLAVVMGLGPNQRVVSASPVAYVVEVETTHLRNSTIHTSTVVSRSTDYRRIEIS